MCNVCFLLFPSIASYEGRSNIVMHNLLHMLDMEKNTRNCNVKSVFALEVFCLIMIVEGAQSLVRFSSLIFSCQKTFCVLQYTQEQ